MLNKKRILCLLLALTTAFACSTLVSCNKEEAPKELTYEISVRDSLGNPCTDGVIVRILQNGEQAAMQPCDADGKVTKLLMAGEYTVSVEFTDKSLSYNISGDLTLTPEKTSIQVIADKKITSEPVELYAAGNQNNAYRISLGCTYAELESGKRNYFLFAPTESGTYKFSIIGNEKAVIGYYGAPHYVQDNGIAEVTDNSFTVSVSAGMIGSGDTGTSTYVIGVDPADESVQSCVLAIERIGDPAWSIEDEPWTVYKTTADLVPYTLPENAVLNEFDLTASTDTYQLVFNEDDGFYHIGTADGPLVLVRLAEDCEYIACFSTILERSGVSKYFFDENGEFVKKENYADCLFDYIECVDEIEGVYPLTEDLKYIIQQRGDYVGWWDKDSSGYLFKDADGNNLLDINSEIAWLLMCCYIE